MVVEVEAGATCSIRDVKVTRMWWSRSNGQPVVVGGKGNNQQDHAARGCPDVDGAAKRFKFS